MRFWRENRLFPNFRFFRIFSFSFIFFARSRAFSLSFCWMQATHSVRFGCRGFFPQVLQVFVVLHIDFGFKMFLPPSIVFLPWKWSVSVIFSPSLHSFSHSCHISLIVFFGVLFGLFFEPFFRVEVEHKNWNYWPNKIFASSFRRLISPLRTFPPAVRHHCWCMWSPCFRTDT